MVQFLFRNSGIGPGHCAQIGIRVLGDLPIYCSLDSSDVWSSPMFQLDKQGNRSAWRESSELLLRNGQLWGNPLTTGAPHGQRYRWWTSYRQMRRVPRSPHRPLQGFMRLWEVPADSPCPTGTWRKWPAGAVRPGPGEPGRTPAQRGRDGIITPRCAAQTEQGFPEWWICSSPWEDGTFARPG
jgi:4-alpha-glucanotransferase